MALTADREILQGDTGPPLYLRLEDGNGELIPNLAEAQSIRVLMRKGSRLISGPVVVIDPPQPDPDDPDGPLFNGRYDWADGDTAVPGRYLTESEVTVSPGDVRTIPSGLINGKRVRRPVVLISPDLDSAG